MKVSLTPSRLKTFDVSPGVTLRSGMSLTGRESPERLLHHQIKVDHLDLPVLDNHPKYPNLPL